MKSASLLLIFLMSVSLLYTGCKSGEQGADNPVEEVIEKTEEMHEQMEEKVDQEAPPKLAAEVWSLIQSENYSQHWKMLPGMDAFYEGQDGKLHTTYLNPKALNALENDQEMPPGSIVVTENYDLEKTLESISVKTNIPGYDNGEEGWFSVTYDPAGNPVSYE